MRRVLIALLCLNSLWLCAQQKDPAEAEKKPSKAKKVLRRAAPDCISILFHKCPALSSREEDIQISSEKQLAQAAERCKLLEAQRPGSLRSAKREKSEAQAGESSSKAQISENVHPYCTPEDVLEAEHDVEVGDFYVEDKNYRGAEMRYRSALERIPGDPIATVRLAQLLEKQKRNAEALALYRQFMAWSPTDKDAEDAKAAIARLENIAATQ